MNSLYTFYSWTDIIAVLSYLIVTIFLCMKLSSHRSTFLFLSILHFTMTCFYYYNGTVSIDVSDCAMYYRVSYQYSGSWISILSIRESVSFIWFLCLPLIHLLKLNYLGCFISFSMVGLLGWFLLFRVILDVLVSKKSSKWIYFVFLPQLHYWTCAIGKDSILFFLICFALFTWHFRKPMWTFFFSMLLIAPIRIHIAVGIMLAYVLSVFYSKRYYTWRVKILLALVSLVGLFLSFKVAMQVTNSLNAQELSEYVTRDDAKYSDTNAGVDLSGASWGVKVLSFLFRPLFFDARNYLMIEASVENVFWVLLCLTIALRLCNRQTRREADWHYLGFAILSILILSLGLSYGNSNLGIAVRQKTMIFPFLFYSLFLLQPLKLSQKYKTINTPTSINPLLK